jgi:hypothetical protein
MVNQYMCNLDTPQDYLVHGKLGAHYSKNWTKEKQQEYNKWYYKTHRDKANAINERNGLGPNSVSNTILRSDIHKTKKLRDEAQSNAITAAVTGDYDNARFYKSETSYLNERLSKKNSELASRQRRAQKDIDEDKDKLSNKVRYDVETTLSKIKNKLLK